MSIVVFGRAARTGWQNYSSGPEYRDQSEVFAEDSLASWQGAPVTVGHPNEHVDLDTVRSVAVGYVRSAVRDGDHVLAEMVITDRDAIEKIQDGTFAELSAGYTTEKDDQKWQRQIRINHLALLYKGDARCGRSCSLV